MDHISSFSPVLPVTGPPAEIKENPPPEIAASLPLSDSFRTGEPAMADHARPAAGEKVTIQPLPGQDADSPSQFLTALLERDEEAQVTSPLGNLDNVSESLKALARETGNGAVPEEALRTAAHLSNLFAHRAAINLSPSYRADETKEKDMALAAGSAALVDHWWNNGQVEVFKDGALVKPGALDLKEQLKNRRSLVSGSRLTIESPPSYPLSSRHVAGEIMKSVDPYGGKKKPSEIEKLRDIDQKDPAQARELMEIIIGTAVESTGYSAMDPAKPPWSMKEVTRLLLHAKDEPWLAELMKPFLPALKELPARAHGLNRLGVNKFWGGDYTDYISSLAGTFPGAVDTAFIERSLSPLLLSREPGTTYKASKLAGELLEQQPALMKPTVNLLFREPLKPTLGARQWEVLELAVNKHGWMPQQGDPETCAARLCQSKEQRSSSLFDQNGMCDGNFGEGIKFFSLVKGKNPEALKGFELPGADGAPLPLEKAILERILKDPGTPDDILRSLHVSPGLDFDEGKRIAAFYHLIETNGPLVDGMLQSLKEGLKGAGSIDGMKKEEQRTLVMLTAMTLPETQQAALREILFPARLQTQYSCFFNAPMDGIRREEIEKGLEEVGKGIPADTAPFFERIREICCTQYCMWDSSKPYDVYEPLLKALAERAHTHPDEAKPLVARMMGEFSASLARYSVISAMPENDAVLLLILENLSRNDDTLRRDLHTTLTPALTADHGNCKGFDGLLDPFRQADFAENLKTLKDAPLTHKERCDLVDANQKLARSSRAFNASESGRQTLLAFGEGITARAASKPLGEMPAFFTEPRQSYQAYAGLVNAEDDDACSREWVKLRDIIGKVGGKGNLELALEIYHYVEEAVKTGADREKALQHALYCRTIGADPHTTPMDTEEGPATSTNLEVHDGYIEIDGMKLEVNRES